MARSSKNRSFQFGRFSLLTCLLICSTSLFAGGPWPKKKGEIYFKVAEWWTVYDQHFTDAGLKDPNITTGIFNTLAYAEYGITDRLTGIFNGALFSRNYMNNVVSLTTGEVITNGEAINTVGDFELGIKYGLTKNDVLPISVSVFLGIPSGTSSGGTLGNLQTGDGEFNQRIQLDIGKSFNWIGSNSAYVSAYAGLNNRTQEFSEEFRYGFELGLSWFDSQLWTTARLNSIESFKNGSTAATTSSTGIFSNNTEFASFGFEINYSFANDIGISLGVASAFRGELIAAAPAYSVGFFVDLSQK